MNRRAFLGMSSLLLLGFGKQKLKANNHALYTPQVIFTSGINGGIPNSKFPLLFYSSVIPKDVKDRADYLENLFTQNSWQCAWRYQIFSFHHFHSKAHECVACFAGNAQLQIGGEGGKIIDVGIGDVLIIPAGVGHKQVKASSDFCMVGAYPINQRADVCRDDIAYLATAQANIAKVAMPNTDPLNAKTGGLINLWKQS